MRWYVNDPCSLLGDSSNFRGFSDATDEGVQDAMDSTDFEGFAPGPSVDKGKGKARRD